MSSMPGKQTFIRKTKDFVAEKARFAVGASSVDAIVMHTSLLEDFDEGKSAKALIQKIALKLEGASCHGR
jgi:hypothetical protein